MALKSAGPKFSMPLPLLLRMLKAICFSWLLVSLGNGLRQHLCLICSMMDQKSLQERSPCQTPSQWSR
eukprot:1804526-Lingulodinium_polyedra.AAC.1